MPGGSTREVLAQRYERAAAAVSLAQRSMEEAAPLREDYPGPETFARAVAEHGRHMKRLGRLLLELHTLRAVVAVRTSQIGVVP